MTAETRTDLSSEREQRILDGFGANHPRYARVMNVLRIIRSNGNDSLAQTEEHRAMFGERKTVLAQPNVNEDKSDIVELFPVNRDLDSLDGLAALADRHQANMRQRQKPEEASQLLA